MIANGRRLPVLVLTAALAFTAAVAPATARAGQGSKIKPMLQQLVRLGGAEGAAAARVLGIFLSEGGEAAGRLAWREAAALRRGLTPSSIRAAETLEEIGRMLGVSSREAAGIFTSPSWIAGSMRTLPAVASEMSITWESTSVAHVLEGIDRGARDPQRGFAMAPTFYAARVAEWQQMGDKGIAILGSRLDHPELMPIVAEWEAQGFKVFFFEFCRDVGGILCPPETVGAFAATAGHVFWMDTPAGRASRFVGPEIDVLVRARTGAPRALRITPRRLLGGAGVSLVAFSQTDQ